MGLFPEMHKYSCAIPASAPLARAFGAFANWLLRALPSPAPPMTIGGALFCKKISTARVDKITKTCIMHNTVY